jgi:uncharacterized OB-fold protein
MAPILMNGCGLSPGSANPAASLLILNARSAPNVAEISFDDTPLSGNGTLYTYSVVAGNGAPSEFDDEQTMTGDVLCGVVELKEGPRVMVRLADVDPEQLHIGMKLRAVIRRLYDQEGFLRYGTKFEPVGS